MSSASFGTTPSERRGKVSGIEEEARKLTFSALRWCWLPTSHNPLAYVEWAISPFPWWSQSFAHQALQQRSSSTTERSISATGEARATSAATFTQ